MKTILLCAALSALAFAQDAKVAKPDVPAAIPTDRALTETESLKLQVLSLKIELLQAKYRIKPMPIPSGADNYQDELKPLNAEWQTTAEGFCKSVGIPQDLIATQCQINTGGKATDGSPIVARVWWMRPQPAPTSSNSSK